MNATEEQVLSTAADLVAAFGAARVENYFGFFAPDATFVFHTTARLLESRAEYEAQWREWEQTENFRVLSCESSEQRVQDLGDTAVFTHRVRTVVSVGGARDELRERETIVFRREGTGRWVAVHEHLSVDPAPA